MNKKKPVTHKFSSPLWHPIREKKYKINPKIFEIKIILFNILEEKENEFLRNFLSLIKVLIHLYLIELFIKFKNSLVFLILLDNS